MKVIARNIITNENRIVTYPRADYGPIVGGNPDIRYYILVDEPFNESYDSFTHYTVLNEEFTETPHNEYPHIFICRRYYTLQQFEYSVINENLNLSVGNHIELNLPLWKSIKYTQRLFELKNKAVLSVAELEELDYITRLIDWTSRLREERDMREIQLVSYDILPSFEWEEVPIRNLI